MSPASRSRPVLQFSAGGLVVDEAGRVLLIRARDLRNQPVWTLPKGALNPGESAADAALREVREETGWECEVVRELDAVTYWFQRDGRRIRKTVRWYRMRPLRKAGEHDHEVDEVLWTDPGDARARLRYESDLKLVVGLGGPEMAPQTPNARGVPGTRDAPRSPDPAKAVTPLDRGVPPKP